MSSMYIVTLFKLICRVHHVKFWAGWLTSWIKIARRNINNLRYADDTTLMAESEEELKSLLVRVKEESEKVTWNTTFKKLRSCIWSHHFKANGGKVETVTDFIFLGSKITAHSDCRHEIKRCLLLGRKVMTNLYVCVQGQSLQLCLIHCDTMDCSPSVHGIL